jgi:hypothetical protein
LRSEIAIVLRLKGSIRIVFPTLIPITCSPPRVPRAIAQRDRSASGEGERGEERLY